MTRHIAIAAGGTGGHMVPAAALAGKLRAGGHRLSLFTDPRGTAFVPLFGEAKTHILTMESHMAGGIVGKIKSLLRMLGAIGRARGLLLADKPDLVVGFGGYPSFPTVMAARRLKIPYLLHEQNAVMGRVNRFLMAGARGLALPSEDFTFQPGKRGAPPPHAVRAARRVTGNPVRDSILEAAQLPYAGPQPAGPVTIFVLGGSQGARILSHVVPQALSGLPADERRRLSVVQQARPEDVPVVREAYQNAGIAAEVAPFFDDVAAILARSHLVVCRAGASTLAELQVMGRPAIFVPLAIAADDHQSANIEGVVTAGGAWSIPEAAFTAPALTERIQQLTSQPHLLQSASDAMRASGRPAAADDLAAFVTELCEGHP